ncbi:MAG: hypothetical protein IK064_02440 [Clostridia bacterium]|nr:hypothetical protein [Clostridia bacterium]
MSDDRDKIEYFPDRERKKRLSGKPGSVINIAAHNGLFIRKADEKADTGDYIGALRLYRRALADSRDKSERMDIRLRIADTFLDMNCFVDAAGQVAPMLYPECPEFRAACFRMGHSLAGRGEFKAAKEAFWLSLAANDDADSVPLDADDAANALECIDFCDQYMDDELAAPTLRDADEVEIEAIISAAAKHSDVGKFEEAVPILEDGYEKHPGSLTLFTDLMLGYYCEQRFSDGMRLYNGAPEELKDDFTVQCCAAMIFARLGLTEQQRECAERVRGYDISDTQQIVRAFATMMELGLYESALEYAQRAYELEPYNRNFIHFCGHAAYRLGKYELAKHYYGRSLAIEPNDSNAYYYKGVCEATIADGEQRSFQIDYSVPHVEFIERCKYAEELARLEKEELDARWQQERGKVLRMTDWAMTDRSCPYADLFIVLLMLHEPVRAEALLRRLLAEPDCSDALRKLAAARLGALCPNKRFCMFREEGFSVCSFGGSLNYSEWPESYRRIIELVYSELGDKSPELFAEAGRLCYRYTIRNYREHPRLPYGQPEAMAAAIVYFVTAKSDEADAPDMNAFAASHGVTKRRLENALNRLFSLPAPDLVGTLLNSIDTDAAPEDEADGPEPKAGTPAPILSFDDRGGNTPKQDDGDDDDE